MPITCQTWITWINNYLSRIFIDRLCRQVFDAGHYEALLRQGLDFFEVARFNAVPERWWRGSAYGGAACSSILSRYAPENGEGNVPEAYQDTVSQTADSVLQCYRCQGFWHMAANCRHLPRCVRCGEPHSVEFCPRPRNNPICCHCSGPHHAGRIFSFVKDQRIFSIARLSLISHQYPLHASIIKVNEQSNYDYVRNLIVSRKCIYISCL